MQPKVQSDDEREPEHSGSSSQSSLGSAHGSLWLRWLRPITAFGAGPRRLFRLSCRFGVRLQKYMRGRIPLSRLDMGQARHPGTDRTLLVEAHAAPTREK